ncbi:HET-R [Cladorrhinum samala]|uniref:HET-R n=1 Tax=Cladorrhinum samala TaxID=585594 RepID=A0AAV9HDU2_9PEZI|nr:HET-R [Cladorrhinum samala]
MRLLERDDAGEFRLKDLPSNTIPPYAILSHTWGDEEVLFKDLVDGTAKENAGYAKLQFCGDQAWRDGLKYFWVDTCCIDKSDAAELQHALNSMFQWYCNATKCYVYLADVSTRKRGADGNSIWELAFRKCKWFTRGWTLQELIAPMIVEFFSKEGERLGDKRSLEQEICNITEIPPAALQGRPLSDFSVAERLAWMEKRDTKFEEDKAYSLFGIFDIHIPVIYGEGKQKALKRLRDKIHEDYLCLAKLWSGDPRDPHHDKKRIELAKGGLVADAYRWIFEHAEFQRWHHTSESRLLWIKGDPGKGKTMLLCGIIDELEQSITASGGNLAYFFCQATDSRINSAIAALRGLIYILARRQPRLLFHLPENTYASDDAMAWVVLSKVLRDMLEDPGLKETYLVIDALDECVVNLPKLLDLIVHNSPRHVKWLLSSRNEVHIEEKLKPDVGRTRLSLEVKANAVQVAHAIDAYIDQKLSGLTSLQDDALLKNQVRDILHQKANGTFLWVALVIQELSQDDVESWHALQIVNEVPPGLDKMYDRMLDQISRHKRDSEFCRRILSAATAAYRPLYLDEIGGLSGLPEQILRSTENVKKIVTKCGSFLTIRENQIYLIHQSAKDYLSASALIFPDGGAPTAHQDICARSLKLMLQNLRRDMYGLIAPGFPIDQVRTPEPDPLATVRYSCVFWVNHLSHSISDRNTMQPNILDTVQTFLEQKYLYWLESLSLLRAMSEGGRTSQRQLTAFIRDAHRFVLSYRWIIEQAPLQAYTTALVFAPVNSLVKKRFNIEEPRWVDIRPVVDTDWNVCLQTLEGHTYSVSSVAFSPDNQRLASGSADYTIVIWDSASGQCLQVLKGHSNWVRSVTFSSNSQQLISGSDDRTIKIWDPTSGQCLQTLEGHTYSVSSVAFSPDNQRLASGSADCTVKIWDPASGQCLQTLEGHSNWVRSVTFQPNSQRLISGSDDCTIKIWDPVSGQCLQTLEGHSSSVQSVTFSPDSQRLASGSIDSTVKIWDPASGQCLQTLKGHSSWVHTVSFSPDSQRLASGSDDRTVKIWDPASGQCLQTLKGHSRPVLSVAFSPNSQRLASGSDDCDVKSWDPASSGQCLQTTLEGHSKPVFSVAFSPDSQRLASGSADYTVKIWDPASGQCLQTLKGHSRPVRAVAFSPNNQRLASGSDDRTIKIWDPASSGQCLHTVKGHSSWIYSVAFSPDNQRLVSGSADRTVKIWNPSSWQCLQTLEGYGNYVFWIDFSPNSQRFISGLHDGTVKIWDLASGKCLQKLEGYSCLALPVTFWQDNLATYGYGLGTDSTWVTFNGRKVLWLPPEYRPISAAVQGRMVAIGCRSGRVLTIGFSRDA